MEKPQYIDWIVEETGIVIKDDIPLKCYKIVIKMMKIFLMTGHCTFREIT